MTMALSFSCSPPCIPAGEGTCYEYFKITSSVFFPQPYILKKFFKAQRHHAPFTESFFAPFCVCKISHSLF